MKSLKVILGMVAIATIFTSCKDENKEMAQKELDAYKSYVDSISNVATNEAAANWESIEASFEKSKKNAESAVEKVEDKITFQANLDETTFKYEEFKTNVVAEKVKMDAENSKMAMRKSLLGASYDGSDMAFPWVNKDNILSVYDNFVSTVKSNKDSYSREDWDEIKLIYEALDTRKNTIEKEGLSSSDNMKIASLKVQFAPMYTLNRIGAKSGENAAAKE